MSFSERNLGTDSWQERSLNADSWTQRSDLDVDCFVKSGETGTDTTPPTISGFYAKEIGTNYAIFDWDTDEEANCRVDYSTNFPFYEGEVIRGTTHEHYILSNREYIITELSPDTLYYVIAYSVDRYGNSGNSGYFTFRTAGNNKGGEPPTRHNP